MSAATSTRGRSLWRPQARMGMPPEDVLVIEGGDGAYIVTDDGRRLLDAVAGLWHANVGHGRTEIARAMAEQVRQLETYHLFGNYANGPALDLADRIASMAPVADSRVFFTSGGSDSVDLACKLARRHWQEEGEGQKRIIASRVDAYHGLHAFGTSIGGLVDNRRGYGSESLVPETVRVAHSDLAAVRRTIAEVGPEHVAALVAEPVMGTGGVIPPAPGYLEGLQDLCREHDILFVVDEVITGFGRTGTMFACERFGLEPDMLLFAKGVTSGYAPLGGVIVAPRVWERYFAGPEAPIFHHGITYSGHATSCVAAIANLDILEGENLVARAAELEGVMAAALEPLAGLDPVVDVRAGVGALVGVQLAPDVDGAAVAAECVERGVVIRPINGNTLQVSPPFVVTDEEVVRIGAVLGEVLSDFDAGSPGPPASEPNRPGASAPIAQGEK